MPTESAPKAIGGGGTGTHVAMTHAGGAEWEFASSPSSVVMVFVDGILQPAAIWTYNPATGKIAFGGGDVPDSTASVEALVN